MKTLVAYYSRTGTTKKVAEAIAKELKADIDEIIDKKDRKGPIGYLMSGKDSMQKRMTEIEFKKDPSKYDLVVLGTPVWAQDMTPALRTYLTKNKVKKTAYFVTSLGSGANSTFRNLTKLTGIEPKATLSLHATDVMKGYKQKMDKFIKGLSTY